jgi:hypothetical protein
MLKDFILTPDKVITEGLAGNEEAAFANILYEDSQELKTFIAAFLQENPAWQQNWASGTKLDPQNRIIHGSPRAYTVFGGRPKWF